MPLKRLFKAPAQANNLAQKSKKFQIKLSSFEFVFYNAK